MVTKKYTEVGEFYDLIEEIKYFVMILVLFLIYIAQVVQELSSNTIYLYSPHKLFI